MGLKKFLIKLKNQIRIGWAHFLRGQLGKILKEEACKTYQDKIQYTREYVYTDIPLLLQTPNLSVIEGGSYNYFVNHDGSLPFYHFVIPELNLYIYIASYEEASWVSASQMGLTRNEWELSQKKLVLLKESTSQIITDGEEAQLAKLLVIEWEEPFNKLYLTKQLMKLLGKSHE